MANLRNFTHTSNFTFQTNLFTEEETAYSVQEAPLPGLSFSHIQTSRNAVFGNIQGDTITYNDLTLSFIMDEKLTIWKEIVGKMIKMRDPNQVTAEQIEKYGYLEIHDDNSKEVLKLEFVNCMIESIDDLQYSTTSEDEIITCSVTIKYDYYNIVEKDNINWAQDEE